MTKTTYSWAWTLNLKMFRTWWFWSLGSSCSSRCFACLQWQVFRSATLFLFPTRMTTNCCEGHLQIWVHVVLPLVKKYFRVTRSIHLQNYRVITTFNDTRGTQVLTHDWWWCYPEKRASAIPHLGKCGQRCLIDWFPYFSLTAFLHFTVFRRFRFSLD